ncbi:class I SAM-dependent methyltransferase [Allocoleopsis franciscana]|uniref:Methyltransferase family protein n=1 Tax=Allocoleopsis franciscana PCC 7113 TaxID=1173027 RepID=K9WA00_9CYAN|nr:class I SAM-dependent methyltransferase [Allocoleopsis franciscana]AFZ16636.1 methyltransferase family protein [Allocoleopsis franciscana PCC 7113]
MLLENQVIHNEYYKEDLAFIHDVGFADYALKSAPGLLEILKQNQIGEGLVVDLGCGSGLWALELTKAHYQVLGVDLSKSLIAIARQRVPEAEFRIGSLFQADIPPCNAVTSIGECLNYLFDSNNNHQTLIQLFSGIYRALTPGGVFIFDMAEPGQVLQETPTQGFTEGDDWIVLVEKAENREQKTLTRRIITFRKVGGHYRRDDEVHHLQLYDATEVAQELSAIGFQVQMMPSYGHYSLPKAHTAFIARKPTK